MQTLWIGIALTLEDIVITSGYSLSKKVEREISQEDKSTGCLLKERKRASELFLLTKSWDTQEGKK